ncbi:MAG: sensor domain-containing diguanylate cyclase [Desulfocapsaceae bacterium]|nr:sensor domain-containing diguanylate cyclase [Desulfocapsaceae bacterium]
MTAEKHFLDKILNSVTEHIAVIDAQGVICYVNKSWVIFGESNQCVAIKDWQGTNYLEICDQSAALGDDFGRRAAEGIRQVIKSNVDSFYLEYPCHSPEQQRWFMMRVTPFALEEKAYFVISHQNITERKIAEERVLEISRLDGLTGIANRRSLDNFLQDEWQRCARLKVPISLAMIDLDHFKLLNDAYGHQFGDDCLRKVSRLLKKSARRPSDLCGRYGGEEFAIIFGNTGADAASKIVTKLLAAVRGLEIPHKYSPTHSLVTVSIGLATMHPGIDSTHEGLVQLADELLYQAKKNGRNQIACSNSFSKID